MAITHEGTETAVDSDAASGGSSTLTVAKPAGAAEDDVAVAVIYVDDVDPTSLPTGFTEIATVTPDNAATLVFGYKVLGASEPSSYDFTKDSIEDAIAAISIFRGVDTASPLDATSSTNTGDSASPTAPSITTSTDGAALVAFAGMERDSGSPYSPPSGMTELSDLATAGGTLGAGSVSFTHAWGIQSSAGASGDKQFTADDDDWWGAGLIALKPVPTESTIDLGLITETETVNALRGQKLHTLNLIQEGETLNQLNLAYGFNLGLIEDSETLFPISGSKNRLLGLIEESELINSPTLAKRLNLTLLEESESLFGIEVNKGLALGIIQETDTLFPLSGRKIAHFNLIQEEEILFDLTLSKQTILELGLIEEEEFVFHISAGKQIHLGLINESDTLFPISGGNSIQLGLIEEVENLLAISRSRGLNLGLIQESDVPKPITLGTPHLVGRDLLTRIRFIRFPERWFTRWNLKLKK